jgi:hypothetical protein
MAKSVRGKKRSTVKPPISAKLEKQLNGKLRDAAFRKTVFADPIAVLKREGVKIRPEQEQSIARFMKELSVTPRAIELSQMSVGRDLGQGAWGIGISISWKTPGEILEVDPEVGARRS